MSTSEAGRRVLGQGVGHASLGIAVAGGQNLWRVLEGQQIVDLVEVSVQAIVGPVDADHDVFNWNVRRQTNGVLDVQFL